MPRSADDFLRLTALGEALWSSGEGEALKALKSEMVLVQTLVDRTASNDAECSLNTQLRLLASVGPAFWMIGKAREGLDLARRLCFDPELVDELPTTREVAVNAETLCLPLELAAPPETHHLCGTLTADAAAALPRTLLLACCLDGAGMNAYACTEYTEAARLHEMASSLCDDFLQQSPPGCFGPAARLLLSRALDGLGRVSRESGDYDRSLSLHVRAAMLAATLCAKGAALLPVHFRPAPQACVANAVSNAGVAAYRLGKHSLAKQYHDEARRVRDLIGDLRGLSSTLGNLALLCPDPSEALKLYEQSLSLRATLQDEWGIAGSHRAIATQLMRRDGQGDAVSARGHLATALTMFANVGDSLGIAESLESLGVLWTDEEPIRAAKLLGAAVGVRVQCGAAAGVVTDGCARTEALRALHASVWQEGEALSIRDAIRLGRAAGLEVGELTVTLKR